MNDLAPDHPAIPDEALLAALNAETCRKRTRLAAYAPDHIAEMRRALTAALPHLTADDLRDTPAGRELMAEAWEEGAETAWGRTGEGFNGECAFDHLADRLDQPSTTFRRYNPDTPNPYRESTS